ncbi:MAG: LysR substrate-binding domain-containing protein, partial [Bacillota bacterium]
SKRMTLTRKGQELYKHAARLFEVSDEIERYVKELESVGEVNLRIGVSDEVERPFIADVVGSLAKSNQGKKLSISIISNSHEEISKRVFNHELDVVISNREIRSGLHLVAKIEIPVLLVAASASPEGGMISSSPEKIFSSLEVDLIMADEDLTLGKETKKFLKSVRLSKRVAITSNILSCLVRLVQENVGAAFLPVAYVSKELQKGSLRAYGPRPGYWNHSIYIYTPKMGSKDLALSLVKIIQDLTVMR